MILDSIQAIQEENKALRQTLADIRAHIKAMDVREASQLSREDSERYVAIWDAVDAAIGKL